MTMATWKCGHPIEENDLRNLGRGAARVKCMNALCLQMCENCAEAYHKAEAKKYSDVRWNADHTKLISTPAGAEQQAAYVQRRMKARQSIIYSIKL